MAAVDVLIIGAGPAGLAAGLRLRQLGYEVALLERSKLWPRAHIGEALTPGVKAVFDQLEAHAALAGVPQRAQIPTQIQWKSRTPEMVSNGSTLLIDRAGMDAALLGLARERGVHVLQPAQTGPVAGEPGAWQVPVRRAAGVETWSARFILDATGRHGNAARHVHCAPRLLAMWAEFDSHELDPGLLAMTHIAALEHGWLWGTCLPNRRYRLLLACDPKTPHRLMPGQPLAWLYRQCREHPWFAGLQQHAMIGNFHACCTTPWFASDFWQAGRIKIGDCAFSLDPVSSSGVEKAMRFALHAATAVHTLLRDEKHAPQELVHEFLRERLVDACARHNLWAQRQYRQAWCSDAPFWRERSSPWQAVCRDAEGAAIADALQAEMTHLRQFRPPVPNQGPMLRAWQHIRFDERVELVQMACVLDGCVKMRPALAHPHLERPLAFLENEALLPRLEMILQQPTLGRVLDELAPSISMTKAQRILGWLWMRGLLQSLD